ncbi:hypothetical protein HOC80_01370 [archaeon]|jgi:hypothetical protein|nr:hypothetical protein [archaeon]MBT4416731.1 hypothetical protein [archaeon]
MSRFPGREIVMYGNSAESHLLAHNGTIFRDEMYKGKIEPGQQIRFAVWGEHPLPQDQIVYLGTRFPGFDQNHWLPCIRAAGVVTEQAVEKRRVGDEDISFTVGTFVPSEVPRHPYNYEEICPKGF